MCKRVSGREKPLVAETTATATRGFLFYFFFVVFYRFIAAAAASSSSPRDVAGHAAHRGAAGRGVERSARALGETRKR